MIASYMTGLLQGERAKTITTKKTKLAWLVNQITDHDVETFEAAVCAHI